MNSYATRQPTESSVAPEEAGLPAPGMDLDELRRAAEQITTNVESVIDGKHEAVQTALVVLLAEATSSSRMCPVSARPCWPSRSPNLSTAR